MPGGFPYGHDPWLALLWGTDMTRIFGKRSLDNLSTCHPALRRVAVRALMLTTQDFTIIEGHRGRAAQEAAYKARASKVRFPNSAHNQQPSCALDVIPYPFKGWNDKNIHAELKEIARAFFAAAKAEGVSIRWGGNWSSTSVDAPGTKFVDSPHFELHPWANYASDKPK